MANDGVRDDGKQGNEGERKMKVHRLISTLPDSIDKTGSFDIQQPLA